MERSTTNTPNWWAIAHTFAILGQLGLCVAGTVTFAFARPSSQWDDHMPTSDEFWDDVSTNTTLPWVSGAVGGFTTVINILIFAVLYRAYRLRMVRRIDSQKNAFATATIVASVVLGLVFIADVTLAVNTGLRDLPAICIVASIGSVITIATMLADRYKLWAFYSEQLKHQYVIELTRSSEEGTSAAQGAPPSYEAAVRAPK
ncbi:spindle assembly checkpoint kinase [Hypoxylon texense]